VKSVNHKDMITEALVSIHEIIKDSHNFHYITHIHGVILLSTVFQAGCSSIVANTPTYLFRRLLTMYRASVDLPVLACPIINNTSPMTTSRMTYVYYTTLTTVTSQCANSLL